MFSLEMNQCYQLNYFFYKLQIWSCKILQQPSNRNFNNKYWNVDMTTIYKVWRKQLTVVFDFFYQNQTPSS